MGRRRRPDRRRTVDHRICARGLDGDLRDRRGVVHSNCHLDCRRSDNLGAGRIRPHGPPTEVPDRRSGRWNWPPHHLATRCLPSRRTRVHRCCANNRYSATARCRSHSNSPSNGKSSTRVGDTRCEQPSRCERSAPTVQRHSQPDRRRAVLNRSRRRHARPDEHATLGVAPPSRPTLPDTALEGNTDDQRARDRERAIDSGVRWSCRQVQCGRWGSALGLPSSADWRRIATALP